MKVSTLLILLISFLSLSCNTIYQNTSTSSINTNTIRTAANINPHTTKAVSADTHGVALDTDGDGIPDYKDKELLTLQKCFPVDSSGIGNCPDPECCKEWMQHPLLPLADKNCWVGETEVLFTDRSKVLSIKAKKILDSIAFKMKSYPDCKTVIGTGATSNKREAELSWNRVTAVIQYLISTMVR